MEIRIFVLIVLLTATVASAQPRRRPTFAATTRYESCSDSLGYMCGLRDGGRGGSGMYGSQGSSFGTRPCERYVFKPDGTFKSGSQGGTYEIHKNTVKLRPKGDGPVHAFELVLSADRTTLGGMTRVAR